MTQAPFDERAMGACVGDLLTLSSSLGTWTDRPWFAIAEAVRDTIGRILHADAVCVRVTEPDTGRRVVAAAGATVMEFEAALSLDRASGAGEAAVPALSQLVSAPIGLDEQQGLIAVHCARAGFPSPLDTMLIRIAADHAANLVQHAALLARQKRAEEQVVQQAAQQAAVAHLSARALAGASLDKVMRRVVCTLHRLLQVDCCHVSELASDGRTFLLVSGIGSRQRDHASAHNVRAAGPLAMRMVRSGRPARARDPGLEAAFGTSIFLLDNSIVSGATVTVHGRVHTWGILGVHSRTKRAFTEHEMNLLQSLANLLSAALHRQEAQREREATFEETMEARRQAEEEARGRSEFLAMMSHDLRTPITSIAGYVDILELELHGPITEAQRRDLAQIRHCQTYLLSLINDVLAFLRIGSGRMSYDLAVFPLMELLESVDNLICPQIDAKPLHYVRHGPQDLHVRADRDKLGQILINLISNAVKFTEPGGSISVEWSTNDARPQICVRDTGRGIRADRIEAAFEPYVRIEHDGRPDSEGTGLGLAISREFARGMGGDILVESGVGKGSTFTIVLPPTS